MKVLKFGGTSVANAESIEKVVKIVKDTYKDTKELIVVCSALGGVTNLLFEVAQKASKGDETYKDGLKTIETRHFDIIKELLNIKDQSKAIAQIKLTINELDDLLNGIYLIREVSDRTQAMISSFGERMSSFIITEVIKNKKVKANFVDARNIIKTDDKYACAAVDFKKTNKNIKEAFKELSAVQVVTGFIASNEDAETTTLGRGGSDYTASIIASALKAKEIQIWTDVDGMMTTDPRVVKKAFPLQSLSYTEAMELSHFGAKVIYPPTLQPAFEKKIPIAIKNTFNPDHEGTIISAKNTVKSSFPIKGISSIKEVNLINIHGSGMVGEAGISGRLFTALANNEINIILITQASSEHSICFCIDPEDAKKAKKVIETEFEYELLTKKIDEIIIEKDLSIVAIVGEKMKHTPGIANKMFNCLGNNGINVVAIAQGSSEYNLSVVIQEKDLSKSLISLHEAFFLSGTKSLNLFIVGVGLIGSTLLKQIKNHWQTLVEDKGLKVNVRAIANSRKMLYFDPEDKIDNWKERLDKEGKKSSLEGFVKQMKELNLPNSIFVDNTSNKDIITFYPEILESAISIVTPNKVANSSKYSDYLKLKNAAKANNVQFLYETNVGAGLPVISAMSNLIDSGDDFIKIEAILSGTLSYIFNNFKSGDKFSEVVLGAKNNGFTEPDPRDDLNGMDVARKILILAREAGLPLEMKEVKVENILPKACIDAKTIDDFFVELGKADDHFEKMVSDAENAGKVLRFIATLENGKASVNLKSVDQNHPFYSLSGSDNIISFTTERYKERPLVVKGPGAGAEVTAAGVFADIISVRTHQE